MNIQIQDLNKIYPNGKRALEGVTLHLHPGMFGLLGPNGAGKSTLMRILVTLMQPSSGKVLVNGLDLQQDRGKIRSLIGYLPQDFRFFSQLKTWEFLDYAASLSGLKNKRHRMGKVDEWLEKVGLFDVRDKSANKLSGGMKRRLGIAQALIGEPAVIIVDEPTTGLDPEERIRFRNILSELGEKDAVIILSTHIVGDISSLCQDLALLSNGKVIFNGSPEEMINKAKGHVWQIRATDEEYEAIKAEHIVISTIPYENGWEVQVVGQNVKAKNARPVEPNLEHAYVYFMESYLASEPELTTR